MFWDGDRWVDERAYREQRAREANAARASRQGRDGPATGVIVIALIGLFALGVPLVGATETIPSVVVSPEAGPAGSVTDVYVGGLEPRARGFLAWDGASIPGSDFRAGKAGEYAVRLRIPAGRLGPHTVSVATKQAGGRPTARMTSQLASTTFTVDETAPGDEPDPTPTPRPERTEPPAPDPTPTPLPTVVPRPTDAPATNPPATDPPATNPPDPTRAPTPEPTPNDPDPTPEPDPADCDGSLQSLINAAPSGSTLDLTGCSFSGGATIDRPLTLVGATISTGRSGLTVNANNVTLRGLRIVGPQATSFDGNQVAIKAEGSASSPVRNLVIRDSVLRRFGYGGIHLRFVTDFTIRDNVIQDGVYMGMMVISSVDGLISGNTVERIGVVGAAANSNNAYGIALTQAIASSPRSTDITVANNTVLDVPTWHGLDTHGGARITWTGNTVRGCRDGIYITGWPTNRALDNVIDGNFVYNSGSNQYGITSVYSTGGQVTNNLISGWLAGHAILKTSGSDPTATAIDLTVSGNTIK
jgi:nitrous oxidase accessory protein NosD